jgi:hypothetical protein
MAIDQRCKIKIAMQECKKRRVLTGKASEHFATGERCVHKQADNSFGDGVAYKSSRESAISPYARYVTCLGTSRRW